MTVLGPCYPGFMSAGNEVDEQCSELLGRLVRLGKLVKQNPNSTESVDSSTTADADWLYLKTIYPECKASLESASQAILDSANEVANDQLQRRKPESKPFCLRRPNAGAYADKVVEILDGMFEEIDTNLDILQGKRKLDPATAEPSKALPILPAKRKHLVHAPANATVVRPLDSSINCPKVHPLEAQLGEMICKKYSWLSGPLPSSVFQRVPEDQLRQLRDTNENEDITNLTWVDSLEVLQEACKHLQEQSMIAVDLENHSYHSFHGYSCLMQLSSRTRDFLIDTVKLRCHIGLVLGEAVFSNPAILKVFHGAESDVQWLQRDFNIFVLSMFDTFYAARALQMERHSLAFLLETFVPGIQVDKHYQLADWRERPLSAEMIRYARQDTHYLLDIYDRLKNQLLSDGTDQNGTEKPEMGALFEVFRQSAHRCKALYKPDIPGPNSWKSVLAKSNVPLTSAEQRTVKAIYEWRDRVAREADESLHAVLPNFMILRLARMSPGKDPRTILESARADYSVALKYFDDLLNALTSCSDLQKTTKDEKVKKQSQKPAESSTRQHLRFDDELDSTSNVNLSTPVVPEISAKVTEENNVDAKENSEDSAKRRKIGFASTLPSTGGLAGFFAKKKPSASAPSAEPVIASLPFTRSQQFGASILSPKTLETVPVQEAPLKAPAPPTINPIESSNVAIVLSTGQKFDAETLLEGSSSSGSIINLANASKKKRKALKSSSEKPDLVVDYEAIKEEHKMLVKPKDTSEAKDDRFEERQVISDRLKAPRLSSHVKGGNRMSSFMSSKKKN